MKKLVLNFRAELLKIDRRYVMRQLLVYRYKWSAWVTSDPCPPFVRKSFWKINNNDSSVFSVTKIGIDRIVKGRGQED